MRIVPRGTVAAKPNKFNAQKTEVDGITFHSLKEARRYGELKLLERAGKVSELALQVKMPIEINGKHICNYFADFVYTDIATNKVTIEDTKGVRTPLYKLKKKLVEAQYRVTILET